MFSIPVIIMNFTKDATLDSLPLETAIVIVLHAILCDNKFGFMDNYFSTKIVTR